MSYQAVPIQDRVDIDNLFSAYAYTLDEGDADGWIALYTEDGVFDVPGLNRLSAYNKREWLVCMDVFLRICGVCLK